MPERGKYDPALEQAAAQEAQDYLGGATARSALEDSALLSRFEEIGEELLRIGLARMEEALSEGEVAPFALALSATREAAGMLLKPLVSFAAKTAAAEVAAEAQAAGYEVQPEAQEEEPDTARLEALLDRFIGDLAEAIWRRIAAAEAKGEELGEAIASLTAHTSFGRALAANFGRRFLTILRTEAMREANLARCRKLQRLYSENFLVKYLYFDNAQCDGSCLKWATGGLNGRGIYKLHEAPRPVIDTHPNCRCLLVPMPRMFVPLLLPPATAGAAWYADVGWKQNLLNAEFRKGLAEGFISQFNPLNFSPLFQAIKIAETLGIIYATEEHKEQFFRDQAALADKTLTDFITQDPGQGGRLRGYFLAELLFGAGCGKAQPYLSGTMQFSLPPQALRAVQRLKPLMTKVKKLWQGVAKRLRPSWWKAMGSHRLGRLGERLLAKWAELNGRRILMHPESRPLNAPGPDMVTIMERDGKIVVEIWDNKAICSKETISDAGCLKKVTQESLQKNDLAAVLKESGLKEAQIKDILSQIDGKVDLIELKISNAGGTAKAGPKLQQSHILFEDIKF